MRLCAVIFVLSVAHCRAIQAASARLPFPSLLGAGGVGAANGWRSSVQRLRGGANYEMVMDMRPDGPNLGSNLEEAGIDPLDLCFGPECKKPRGTGLFPLPPMSLRRPEKEDLLMEAQGKISPVPNRGTTAQACLYVGRHLNPDVFPKGAFFNERRALLTKRFNIPSDESGSESTVVKDDGKMYFSRARACLRRLEFLNLDWCTRARKGDYIMLSSRVAGIWTTMTNKVLQESFVDTKDYARASITFAMTDRHLLAGEEMLAVHWDKATDAVGFEVCSFSWPQHPLAKIALPIVHLTQRKAAESFCERMIEAVHERRFRLNEETGEVEDLTMSEVI